MKRFILVASVLMSSVCAQAQQEIIASMTDGTSFEQGGVLMDGDQCSFRMEDGRSVDWKVCIDIPEGEAVLKESVHASEMLFNVTPEYKDRQDRRPSRYIVNDDVRWKCHVRSLDDEGNVSELEFFLLVLPSTPQINEVEALYDGFDFEHLCFQNARISFEIESRRAKMAIVSSQYEDSNSTWTNDYLSGCYFIDSASTLKTDYREWDVWERYYIHSTNDYGMSESSDTIYTNDYVTDPEVRHTLGLNVTEIDAVHNQTGLFSIAGRKITVANGQPIEDIGVYTLHGQPVPYSRQGNVISLSTQPSGVVVIRIKSNNTFVTKKIVL